jgi:hypothetical protein
VAGTEAVEVDRIVARNGIVSLGQHLVLAAEILAGRRVAVRVDQNTLMFFDRTLVTCCAFGQTH